MGRRRRDRDLKLGRRARALAAVGWTLAVIAVLWMPPPDVPAVNAALDKLVHFVLFVGVGLAWVLAGGRVWPVLAGGALLGALTEVGQGWLPWPRHPDIADFAFDLAGAVAGALVAAWLTRDRARRA